MTEIIPAASLIYLATPYTLRVNRAGAHREACEIAGHLMRAGLHVFSPIAHSHDIARWGKIDPLDHDFWLGECAIVMAKCDCLMVAHLYGWSESKGIAAEIAFFIKARKPVWDLDPSTLTMAKRKQQAPYRKRMSDMTLDELQEEFTYWDGRVREANGWGGAVAAAHEFRTECERWIARRNSDDRTSAGTVSTPS